MMVPELRYQNVGLTGNGLRHLWAYCIPYNPCSRECLRLIDADLSLLLGVRQVADRMEAGSLFQLKSSLILVPLRNLMVKARPLHLYDQPLERAPLYVPLRYLKKKKKITK